MNWQRCFLTLALLSQSLFAQTADELVQKNLKARGGRERLLALRSLHYQGRSLSGSECSVEVKQQVYVEAPNHYRQEFTLQGMTGVSAFDGQQGWRVSPFGGRTDPERMSPEDSKSLQWATDLAGPLLDYAAKGHKVDYLGREDVDGSDTHVLRLTRASGDSETYYLDPDTFLEIRLVRKILTRGVEREVEIDLGNYALVEGCYLPFSLDSGARGGARSSRLSWDKIEANVPMKPELFQFPGGAREQK